MAADTVAPMPAVSVNSRGRREKMMRLSTIPAKMGASEPLIMHSMNLVMWMPPLLKKWLEDARAAG